MDFGDFVYAILNEQTVLSIVFLLFALFYYFAFYRKLSFNILDAFTVEMISSAGAALGVYVMFVYGDPDKKYLFSFISCEVALYAAIFLVKYFSSKFAPVHRSGIALTEANKDYLRIFFFIVSAFYVILQIVSFKLVGLILFSSDESVNHVNAYADYGPFFMVFFTMNPLFIICLFIKRKVFKKFSLFDYCCIFIALFSMFTSGAKSSFIVFFTGFAVVDYKFAQLENKKKTAIPVIFLIVFFISIILILTIGNISGLESDSAIGKLFQRIALSGDGLVIGYNDSAIKYVLNGPSKTAFGYIFYPFYGKFAILSGTSLRPTIIGIDLYSYAFGLEVDGAGANGRHNLLSAIFWGPYWGWMLSFLIGGFIGYVRFWLYERVSGKSILYLIFICALTSIVPTCITDAYLFNAMLFMLCLLFICFIIITTVAYEMLNIFKSVLLVHAAAQVTKKRSAEIF